MNDRFNTIAGWVLAGGIVLLGATLVTGEVFKHERPETMGYPIEGVVEEGGAGGEEAEQPIAALLATADAARGEAAFRKCSTCHTITPGGAAGIGPNLHGIMGAGVASRGFAYSPDLTAKGGTWDWETMNTWLRSPRGFAPGTKMTFAGLSNPQERADLILYLNSQGSNLPLPPPPAAAPAEGAAPDAATNASGNASGATGNSTAPAVISNNSAAGTGLKGGGEAEPTSVNPGGR
jgi:cytochrome c